MLRTLGRACYTETGSHLLAVSVSDISRSGWGPSFSLASPHSYHSPQSPQHSCRPLPEVPHPPSLGHFLYPHQAQPGPLPPSWESSCSHWEKAPLTFPFCANSPLCQPSVLPASLSLLITIHCARLLPMVPYTEETPAPGGYI